MNNKLLAGLCIVLAAAVGYLGVQNYQLKKQVSEFSEPKGEIKLTPVTPTQGPANPEGASPFDKPNVDPLANQFPAETPPPSRLTTIKFDKMVHDFGRINEGAVVNTKFKFTNTGQMALLISSAHSTCGCTVPQWPRNPIKPGESGEISVQFDSHDKMGEVEKTITIAANTHPAATSLLIKSTIIPKDK